MMVYQTIRHYTFLKMIITICGSALLTGYRNLIKRRKRFGISQAGMDYEMISLLTEQHIKHQTENCFSEVFQDLTCSILMIYSLTTRMFLWPLPSSGSSTELFLLKIIKTPFYRKVFLRHHS